MEALKDLISRVDRYQQRKPLLAVAWAVNKKYGDDRGGNKAALVAYYGLLSVFPLMLVFFSVVLFILSPGSSIVSQLDRHLSSFPILGPSLADVEKGRLNGSIPALVVGLLGLAWGAQGLAQTLQHVMAEVWNIPNSERPGFVLRLATTFKWYAAFGVGVVASTYISSLSSIFGWGPVGPVLASVLAFVVNAGLFFMSFRMLTPSEVKSHDLTRGAIAAGVVWTVLTGVGLGLVEHQLKHSSALYGTLSTVLAILGFMYLAARLTLYCAEYNVVRARHLWPRTILQPPLSSADKQQLIDMARREERVEDETVRVEF
ncbi:YihY/virulence factor BrkB family protein [Acidiferrimicrobium sp. IK]|uniref:YihY/virulence factor BrkB family protein n=1 Tax=Acidiferrimicrobium sp. IK TaxID=2871700 RepID=UPI0021CAFC77|nr:YihY/virulence factor BrkB family protein [Acidiferrimicrobium sp. IK]MCU4187054.1 YihY/virulence factor BrkB family protein [Acidiferrimicrobium sp. IK]